MHKVSRGLWELWGQAKLPLYFKQTVDLIFGRSYPICDKNREHVQKGGPNLVQNNPLGDIAGPGTGQKKPFSWKMTHAPSIGIIIRS